MFDRINFSEGTDGNKTNESRKRIICSYYYFLETNLDFNQKYGMALMI